MGETRRRTFEFIRREVLRDVRPRGARSRRACRLASRAPLSLARFVVEGDARIGLGGWVLEITRAISRCVLFSFSVFLSSSHFFLSQAV
jgi:hypothetical protein